MKKQNKLSPLIVFSFLGLSVNQAHATTFTLPLSKHTTKEAPEAFFCTATKYETVANDDRIFMTNTGQMVKGFTNAGSLIIPADKLNKVYFQAYHDPSEQFKNIPDYITATAGIYQLSCNYGPGTNRTLIDGPFGKPKLF